MEKKSIWMELKQEKDFPLITAEAAESWNCNGDLAQGYVVTKVVRASESKRIDCLKRLLNQNVSAPSIVYGFSYPGSASYTVAEKMLDEIPKSYGEFEKYEVIWFDNLLLEYSNRGASGHERRLRRGIVLHYPEELK